MDGGSWHCTGSKTIPKKKTCKKAKWLFEEALQIAVKRREVKSKGGKERYTHLNALFQRIAKRDEKAFLSEQCKVKEENNRMGKTRDLFKKIRDTKGTFQANMNMKSLSRVLRPHRHHTPLSIGFSRQGYWSGLSFPSPGISCKDGLNTGQKWYGPNRNRRY